MINSQAPTDSQLREMSCVVSNGKHRYKKNKKVYHRVSHEK